MNPIRSQTRRHFLRGVALAAATGVKFGRAASALATSRKPTDIRIERVRFRFEDVVYRSAVKFAGALMDRATLITVECDVRTRSGKVASGVALMPFNHIFSYPSKRLTNDAKNDAMKA